MEIITSQLDAVKEFLNNPADNILNAILALRYETDSKAQEAFVIKFMNIAHPIVESAVLRILELQDVEIQKQKHLNKESVVKEKEILLNKEKEEREKEVRLNKKKDEREIKKSQEKEQELLEKQKMLLVLSEVGCIDYGIEEQLSSITNIADEKPIVPVENNIYESIHAPKNRSNYKEEFQKSFKNKANPK